jgi:hypothetical protein
MAPKLGLGEGTDYVFFKDEQKRRTIFSNSWGWGVVRIKATSSEHSFTLKNMTKS